MVKLISVLRFIQAISLIVLSSYCYAQSLNCKDVLYLANDSARNQEINYPYIVSKPIYADDGDKILLWYRDFFKYLLDDMNYLYFEILNLEDNSTQVVHLPISNKAFNPYLNQYKFTLDDMYLFDNQLYLLIYQDLLVFDISNPSNPVYEHKIKLSDTYAYFTLEKKSKGTFVKLTSTCVDCEETYINVLKLHKNRSTVKKTTKFEFSGKNYLRIESNYVSESRKFLYLGNATLGCISVYDKKVGRLKHNLKFASFVFSGRTDSIIYYDKMQFFSDLKNTDTSSYYFSTVYVGSEFLLAGRARNGKNQPHYLDIYRMDGLTPIYDTTILDGLYNTRNFKNSDENKVVLTFDPLSTARSRCMVNNILYNFNITYPAVYDDENLHFYFLKDEMIEAGRIMREQKDFTFSAYLYEFK